MNACMCVCVSVDVYLENRVLLTQKNHIKLLIDVKIFRKALGENILISLNGLLYSESKFAHVSNALGIMVTVFQCIFVLYVCVFTNQINEIDQTLSSFPCLFVCCVLL